MSATCEMEELPVDALHYVVAWNQTIDTDRWTRTRDPLCAGRAGQHPCAPLRDGSNIGRMVEVQARPESPPALDVHCPQPLDEEGVKLVQQLNDVGAVEVARGREPCKKKKKGNVAAVMTPWYQQWRL